MKQKNSFKEELLDQYHERSQLLSPNVGEHYKWFEFYVEAMYGEFFKNVRKDGPILDLGCSQGGLLRALSQQGFTNLTGVDLSTGDLAIARSANSGIFFVKDDIFDFLEANKNKFKVIILKALIEHIEKKDIHRLLRLINDSLLSGGFVLIDVYNAAYIFCGHERYMDFTHELGFTKESLLQVMAVIFDEACVISKPSPLDLGLRDMIKYKLARSFFRNMVHYMEPEFKNISVLDRLLLGTGKKALNNK